MNKIGFIFPGQGSQYLGMGKKLMEKSKVAKKVIEEANKILDFDLIELLSSSSHNINLTEFTQPAILAVSIAILRVFEFNTGLKPDYVAGLSLGEYSALVANGSIRYDEAIRLVRKRGIFMSEAGKSTDGAMAAVLNGDVERIERYCKEDAGVVVISNYNSPVQIVLSGEKTAVSRICRRLETENICVIPLQVSGAFHSPLMNNAADLFEKEVEEVEIFDGKYKFISNINGKPIEDKAILRHSLVQQLMNSVQFEKSIRYMIDQGVDTFYEIGPGKTLSVMIRKINKNTKVCSINSLDAIDRVSDNINNFVF